MKSTIQFRTGDRARVRGLSCGGSPGQSSRFETFEGKKVIVKGTSKDGMNASVELASDCAFSTEVEVSYLRSLSRETFSRTYERTLTRVSNRLEVDPSDITLLVQKHGPIPDVSSGWAWLASVTTKDDVNFKALGNTPTQALRRLVKNIPAKITGPSIHDLVISAAGKRYGYRSEVDIILHKNPVGWKAFLHMDNKDQLAREGSTAEDAMGNLHTAIIAMATE